MQPTIINHPSLIKAQHFLNEFKRTKDPQFALAVVQLILDNHIKIVPKSGVFKGVK